MSASPESIAVLLNPNARRVDAEVLDIIGDFVDPEHVYISDSEQKARELVDEIVAKGYGTLFAGGGDGTITQLINRLPDDEGAPRVGILKLGTGNAMAEIVSSGDPIVDLRTYTANPSRDAHNLPLCEVEGMRFAFGGLGVDATVLNDYRTLKDNYGDGVMKPLLQNLAGYLVAAFSVTIPRMLRRWLNQGQPTVRIVNEGSPATVLRMEDGTGAVEERLVPTGEVLYEGPVNTVMFGTCPFYGYRMKALPFAGMDPDRFHLRVSNVPIGVVVAIISRLWDGTLNHPGIMDFHADRVRMTFSEPMPYQVAGEAMGYRNEVNIGMSEAGVDLVRFI